MQRAIRFAATLSLGALVVVFGCSNQEVPTVVVASDGGGPATKTNAPAPRQILRQATDYLKGLPAYSCAITVETSVGSAGTMSSTESAYQFRLQRPNRLALVGESDANTITVMSDGNALVQHLPAINSYTRTEAPNEIRDIQYRAAANTLSLLGPAASMLPTGGARHLDGMLKGVVSSKYLGEREVDGVSCYRCQFNQNDFSFVVSVQTGKQPLIRRVELDLSNQLPQFDESMESPTYKLSIAYSTWVVDASFSDNDFVFRPSEQDNEVADLMQQLREEQTYVQQDPIQVNPDAITMTEYGEAMVAFNRRTLSGAYEQVGTRDPAWDEAVTEFLDEVARTFARNPPYLPSNELAVQAKGLIDQGCDDPLVQYCYAAMLQDAGDRTGSPQDIIQMIASSHARLEAAGYPANRRFAAAQRTWRYLESVGHERAGEFYSKTVDACVDMILQDTPSTLEGRIPANSIIQFSTNLPLEKQKEFYESAQIHQDARPWLVNMIGGRYFVELAWESRGRGWAADVTDEGWKGLAQHMETATRLYGEAWESDPSRPEAATAMIQVAMGNSGLTEMRFWFDRAVNAQMDWGEAYENMLYGLMPRWHGSHRMMYEFGIECMKTDRFDTMVPYALVDGLLSIKRDDQNSMGADYFTKPGVYDNVSAVLTRYVDRGEKTDWWRTLQIGFAAMSNHHDEARKMLDDLGDDRLSADALYRLRISQQDLVRLVRGNNGSPESP